VLRTRTETVNAPSVGTSASLAAYAIVRAGDWWLLRSVNSVFLMGLAIPLQAAIIPVYLIVIRLHLYDTLLAIILPLILTQSPSQRTLPLALWTFQGLYSINVPAVLASVVLTILPILALYAIGRRQLLSGLTAGFSR
jgi:raffinose/stachyose/melibiose transport system permease protein